MTYAYLDRFGILHAHPNKETATQYAKWNERVEATELPEDGGYIQIKGDKGNESVFAYADTKQILAGGNTVDHGGHVLEDVPATLHVVLDRLGFYN